METDMYRERIIADMNDIEQGRDAVRAELVSDRDEMIHIHARAIAYVSAAQTALLIASNSRAEPEAACFVDEYGTCMTIRQLADLVEELERREERVRLGIAQLNERIERHRGPAC